MRPTDISQLISILMAIIGLAVATGQFGKLKGFAEREALRASMGWGTPAFFGSAGARSRLRLPKAVVGQSS